MSRSTRSIARRYGLHHGDVTTRAMTHHVTPLRAARQLALERARPQLPGHCATVVSAYVAFRKAAAALALCAPTEQRAVTNSRNGEPHA